MLLRGLVSRLNARLLLKYWNCERKRQPCAGRVPVWNWGFTSCSTAETDKWSEQEKKIKIHTFFPPTMLSICSLPSSWLIEKVTTLVLGRVAGALSGRVPLIGLAFPAASGWGGSRSGCSHCRHIHQQSKKRQQWCSYTTQQCFCPLSTLKRPVRFNSPAGVKCLSFFFFF